MTQHVFQALGSGVGGFGKGSEGCNVGKVPAVELTDIQPPFPTGGDCLGGSGDIRGQLETVCKVVGAAGGDISHGNVQAGAEQTVDRFIEGAVAAHAGDHVEVVSVIKREILSRQPPVSDHDRADKSAGLQNTDDFAHPLYALPDPGIGIDNKQQLFHCSLLTPFAGIVWL